MDAFLFCQVACLKALGSVRMLIYAFYDISCAFCAGEHGQLLTDTSAEDQFEMLNHLLLSASVEGKSQLLSAFLLVYAGHFMCFHTSTPAQAVSGALYLLLCRCTGQGTWRQSAG